MSRRGKMAVLLAILLLAGIVFFAVHDRPGFTGDRVANPDSYTLDIQRMHGTDRHTMELNAGDVLQIRFETEKGSLHLAITAPDETVLYAGNGKGTPDFTVNIPQSGVYAVTVEAKHAAGSLQIQRSNGSYSKNATK